MIYLASPYTHADPAVREQRFDAACRAAGRLMRAGQVIYSPIAHGHPIEMRFADGTILGHDFWLHQCLAVLARCSRMSVLTLDGWEQSRGIAAEMAFAQEHGIPLDFVDP